MTMKALVIDDDPDILSEVSDIVDSLGHQHDQADSVETARECLARGSYSYILLDLEIPVRRGRLSRIQNGDNLLREIIDQTAGKQGPLVIVMTGHGTTGPDLAVEMMQKGAVDYVTKPFKTHGKTLDVCILKALGGSTPSTEDGIKSKAPIVDQVAAAPSPPRQFDGGVLKFFSDRVELCDVDITSGRKSKQTMKAFGLLRRRLHNETLASYGGKKIAELLGLQGGQNGGSGWVRRLRTRITDDLRAKANIECGNEDVIQTTTSGYQLREWLSVQFDGGPDGAEIQGHTASPAPAGDPVNQLRGDPANSGAPVNDPVKTASSGPVNLHDLAKDPAKRRIWILDQLIARRQLRAPHIAAALACGASCVKRDIAALRKAGHNIGFDGSAKIGHYSLGES